MIKCGKFNVLTRHLEISRNNTLEHFCCFSSWSQRFKGTVTTDIQVSSSKKAQHEDWNWSYLTSDIEKQHGIRNAVHTSFRLIGISLISIIFYYLGFWTVWKNIRKKLIRSFRYLLQGKIYFSHFGNPMNELEMTVA